MILGIASPGGGRSERATLGLRTQMWLAHMAGGVVGGAIMGVLVWTLASPLRTFPPERVVVVLFAALAAFFIAWDLKRFNLPFEGGQVPASWIAKRGAVGSYAMYGAFLGAGLITFVPVGMIYVTFGAVGLLLGVVGAVVAGASFGLARAAVVGPAALAAGPTSKVLFRSRFAHFAFPKLSAVASVALAALAAANVFV